MAIRQITCRSVMVTLVLIAATSSAVAQNDDPDWMGKIRDDHPRLFVNDQIKKTVIANAKGREKQVFASIKQRVDTTIRQRKTDMQFILHEGILPEAIVVAWVTGKKRYLDQSLDWLRRGMDHLEARHAKKQGLGHFAYMRIGVLMAYDWLYHDLPEPERKSLGKRLFDHIEAINTEGPYRPDHAGGFPQGGFYGINNLYWFAGLTFHGEGIDDARAKRYLLRGYGDYQKVAAKRAEIAGDDGGVNTAVIGYAFGAYPRAEWNFLHTFQSAIGENRSQMFDYLGLFPNWIAWMIVRGPDGLYHWGTGDSHNWVSRVGNLQDYHLRQIRYFWGEAKPRYARVAQFLMDINPSNSRGTYFWGELYPLLLPAPPEAVDPLTPDEHWPHARNFEGLGHIYMRSAFEPDATYAVFVAGGKATQHKHYDSGHFGIYKSGFQAIRRGTRDRTANQHMTEFYQRTIAHNTLLVRMPGERFPHHWGHVPKTNDGGQNSKTGAKIIAFQTNDQFTYIACDLTGAYSRKKVDKVIRQFLFLHPNHFVIIDQIKATNADYPKTWLLHTMREPKVDGKQFTASWEDGVIFGKTVVPGDAKLETIGGPGKRFFVDGQNFPIDPAYLKRQLDRRNMKLDDALVGHWRVEVTPGAARNDDLFVHVLEVGKKGELTEMHDVRLAVADTLGRSRHSLSIDTEDGQWRLSYYPDDPMDATLQQAAGKAWAEPVKLTREVQPQVGLVIEED